jgi:hypothetical protein
MGSYITQSTQIGDYIVKHEQIDPINYTQKLLDLMTEMNEMVIKYFENDKNFQEQINLSF